MRTMRTCPDVWRTIRRLSDRLPGRGRVREHDLLDGRKCVGEHVVHVECERYNLPWHLHGSLPGSLNHLFYRLVYGLIDGLTLRRMDDGSLAVLLDGVPGGEEPDARTYPIPGTDGTVLVAVGRRSGRIHALLYRDGARRIHDGDLSIPRIPRSHAAWRRGLRTQRAHAWYVARVLDDMGDAARALNAGEPTRQD